MVENGALCGDYEVILLKKGGRRKEATVDLTFSHGAALLFLFFFLSIVFFLVLFFFLSFVFLFFVIFRYRVRKYHRYATINPSSYFFLSSSFYSLSLSVRSYNPEKREREEGKL